MAPICPDLNLRETTCDTACMWYFEHGQHLHQDTRPPILQYYELNNSAKEHGWPVCHCRWWLDCWNESNLNPHWKHSWVAMHNELLALPAGALVVAFVVAAVVSHLAQPETRLPELQAVVLALCLAEVQTIVGAGLLVLVVLVP